MKRSVVASVISICWAVVVFAPAVAVAGYFDGMEAYRQNDYQTALRELKAVDEDVKAQYMIGVIYEKGQGVAVNFAEAAQWYGKAADKGNSAAQYRLGRLCERGLGVEQNREEAVKWYKKAAKQGHVDARQALKRMDAK